MKDFSSFPSFITVVLIWAPAVSVPIGFQNAFFHVNPVFFHVKILEKRLETCFIVSNS